MDIRGLEAIVYRVQKGAMLTARLQLLCVLNTDPHIDAGGKRLPLPAAAGPVIAAAAAKEFVALADRMRLAAEKLEEPTGKTGTPNLRTLQEIQAAPGSIFNAMQGVVQQGKDWLSTLAGATEELDAQGDYQPLDIGDMAAQKTADALATIRLALLWWIDQEQAKLV